MSNLDYVKLLASQTATDISSWDLRMFNRLEDKSQINKVFFEHKNTFTPQIKEVSKRVIKKADSTKFDATRIIKKLETAQDKLQDRIGNLYKRIEEINKLIVGNANRINKLNETGFILEEEINKVLEQGHWENPLIDKGWLFFNTKNEVICTVTNPKAGVDLKVNLGRFAVAINLKTLELRGLPFEKNLVYGDTIHPFIIVGDGHICWGNASPMLASFKRELSLPKMLNLFYALLSVYDDEAFPFTPLSRFSRASKLNFKTYMSGQRYGKPRTPHPEVRKKFVDTKTKKV